ncbi:MAG: DNA polymerase IV [Polyangiaceae bacterium]
MGAEPRVCCMDLDTFFVSVERLLDPSLEGKAVVVGGGKNGRGVVLSSSYEARVFGVRSGMSIRDASRLAPDAIFLPGHHREYSRYSADVRAIVERYSPIVRAASIDEHYIDFHGCEGLYRKPSDEDDDATIARVVREMTDAIATELGLPSSAGIATSKSMAKVACGLAKPRGVRLVRAGTEAETLAPLPVRKLPGIGPVAERKLNEAGIETLGQLTLASEEKLRPIFGRSTEALRASARGEGSAWLGRERPAFREHDPRGERLGTISNERTFVEHSGAVAEAILSSLAERVCFRARKRGMRARTVTLRLRWVDFYTITRSVTISPTHSDTVVRRAIFELYRAARTRSLGIRLLGVALSNLEPDDVQLELFDKDDRRSRAVDRVRAKFGYDAVHLATTVPRRRD